MLVSTTQAFTLFKLLFTVFWRAVLFDEMNCLPKQNWGPTLCHLCSICELILFDLFPIVCAIFRGISCITSEHGQGLLAQTKFPLLIYNPFLERNTTSLIQYKYHTELNGVGSCIEKSVPSIETYADR